ncbi:MAG: 4-alpha-glucanotransferase [Fuerstiella sp.]
MRFPRSSGILLPVFSLPGPFGVGDLGPSAYRFVDFLSQAGQTIWQLLPLGPPARGDSPYSSYSAFAGNPLLTSPAELVTAGLLTSDQIAENGGDGTPTSPDRVDYVTAHTRRQALLKSAFNRFRQPGHEALRRDFAEFCERNQSWLTDFARFDALANQFREPDWSKWESALVHREPDALAAVDARLADEIEFARFQQFLFLSQWHRLKAYANERRVRIYGDMPIFVAYESVDVWTSQDLFRLDDCGRPVVVAGVPPDYFSETGQMWGNPLYCWDRLAETGYDWWIRRFRQAFEFFDILRIDHFRGFESYWEIPSDAQNAIGGAWQKGPGEAPFIAARQALGELPIVAEDLGLITDDVHALRDQLGFPGMRVLQFGFDHEDDPYHRPDSFPEHSVAYTGTHDNDTTMGWYQRRHAEGTDQLIRRFLSKGTDDVRADLIRAVLNSAADTVIIPMQDLLGLGSEARMNTPGLAKGNWRWRCASDCMGEALSQSLRSWTEHAGRLS